MIARVVLLVLGIAVAAPILTGPVYGQDYPARQVTIIIPFSAGSASDVIARIVLERMAPSLGQRFVVDNRPAAGGNVGSLAMNDPAVRARFADFGAEPLASTPEELGRFIAVEVTKWRAIITRAGITVDP